MEIKESFLIAMGALRTNKLRAILTTLGIVIGVMTVIGMMTIIEGINSSVAEQLSIIGTNTFWVQKYPAIQMGGHTRRQYRNRKDIKVEHAEAIKTRASLVTLVSPEQATWGERVKYGGEKTNADVLVYGASEDWQILNGRFVQNGRFLQQMDIHASRRVCIIGTDIVETLFPFQNPIGEEVRVGPNKFRVVGVLEEKGSVFGQSQDNMVVLPYSSFQNIFGHERDISIGIQTESPELLDAAMDEVIGILRTERKVPPGAPNDFEVITQDSLMDAWRNLSSIVFAAAIGIASISLLVGGIGIMNIMLVTVTERTREIGIRKSIGAKKKDILWQFIVEAIVLSAVGGIIGIVLGIGLGKLVGAVTPLRADVPIWAIFLGLGFYSMIGLFFGVYPAGKADKVDPIVALRHE